MLYPKHSSSSDNASEMAYTMQRRGGGQYQFRVCAIKIYVINVGMGTAQRPGYVHRIANAKFMHKQL